MPFLDAKRKNVDINYILMFIINILEFPFYVKLPVIKTICNVKCKGLDSSTHVEHIEQMWLD